METLLFGLRFLVGAAVLLVPGILTAALLRDGKDDDSTARRVDGAASPEQTTHQVLVALGWGAGIVPTLSFFISLFTPLHLTFPLIFAVGLAHSAG